MSQRAAELARQENRQEEAALFETGAALREAFFGNVVEARKRATAALDLSKNREVQYGASFSLALAGDSLTAEVLANDLERRFPQDTSVRFSYVPAVRALSALNHREPAKAVEMLQVSVPYELGAPNSSMHGFFGAMYPVYVRGQAYLVMNEGAKAAAEFQKIVDHSGIVVSDPIGVLARLELGRSYALSGERTRQDPRTRISSHFGRMPIRTFPSLSRRRLNTPRFSRQYPVDSRQLRKKTLSSGQRMAA
jgi:hypothetical protein